MAQSVFMSLYLCLQRQPNFLGLVTFQCFLLQFLNIISMDILNALLTGIYYRDRIKEFHLPILNSTTYTYIKWFQTVPAKGMFTVFAHHLGTAFVPFNINFAFRAAFDGCIIFFHFISRAGRDVLEILWEKCVASPGSRLGNTVSVVN